MLKRLTFSRTGSFIDENENPYNIAHIFRWLVAYITRYCYWRGDAMSALKEFSHQSHPDSLERAKYERQWKRWIKRTEDAFGQFKKALGALIDDYKKLKVLTMKSYSRMEYTIRGLSALVGSSKVRFQTRWGCLSAKAPGAISRWLGRFHHRTLSRKAPYHEA